MTGLGVIWGNVEGANTLTALKEYLGVTTLEVELVQTWDEYCDLLESWGLADPRRDEWGDLMR